MFPASANASNSQGVEAVQNLSSHPAEAPGGLARSPQENDLQPPVARSTPSVNATQSLASAGGSLRLACAQPAGARGSPEYNAPQLPPSLDARRRCQNPPQNKESNHNRGAGSPVLHARCATAESDC